MLDQALDSNDPNNFTTKNSQPMVGFFSNLTQKEDGSGFGLKLAGLYSDNKTTIKRSTLKNTKSGTGEANLKTSRFLAEISRDMKTLSLAKYFQNHPRKLFYLTLFLFLQPPRSLDK